MTQSRPPEETTLDAMLARARDTETRVPDGLMTRVLEDAIREMPKPEKASVWRYLLGALGGWPAVAGLAMTACVGVWAGGVLSDDLVWTLGLTEDASLGFGADLGAFDMLLVDG
ncbi:hypothetical protein MWU54_11475 [Marivita sp. S6314]|uniref:hypothetical protein n=1 Tax=Marivita sp. S6314 TaxID=2926406 RepID=UPI001FF5D041|nr:hypothetical protein [Marivita sp. S6314]MCK0150649.1 hypothetical protein [Marivita sp. S6314]